MKHKIISVAGIATSILLALRESLEVLYNYGTTGLGLYHPLYPPDDFAWETIGPEDWTGFTLCALWYFFLVVPWVQYFLRGRQKRLFGSTLTGKTDFFSVIFTVFNASLIIGSAFMLSRPDNVDELEYVSNYWQDVLLFLIVCSSMVYVPWAIVVIVKNIRRRKLAESEDMQQEQMSVKPVYWFVSLIPFIALTALVVWFSWSDFTYAELREGRADRYENGKWGYVDRKMRVVIPYIYDYASCFRDGRACVGVGEMENRKYGYIDREGNVVIPIVYDEVVVYINGVANVTKDGKCGSIDEDGNELIPVIYDYVGTQFVENDGLAMVRQGDMRGFVRRNGDVVIPIVYEDAETFFSHDLVRVKLYGKWGYLNRKGDVVIPMIYDDAGNFNNGRAEVQLDNERFYIDVKGERIEG